MKIWIDLKVLLMASVVLVTLQGVAAKRSGIGRRAKSSSGRSHSGRSNQQHHYAPQPAPKPAAPPKPVEAPKSATNVASAPKPAAPAANQQPIGWNVGSGKQNPSAPVGPPPPYPGAGGGSHYYPGIGGAPPAYSPRNAHPPSYSSLNHGQSNYPHQSYSPHQQHYSPQMSHAADSSKHYGLGPSHGHNPYMSPGYGGYGGQMGGMGGNPYAMGGNPYAMGGHGYYPGAAAGGFGGMGAAPMMGMGGGLYGGYQKPRSSLFSLSNILTGVALYGTVRSLSGGGWGGGGYGGGYGYGGPKEVHIYDHRDHGKDTAENTAIQHAIGIPGTANITYTASTPTPLAPYPAGPSVPAEVPQEPVEEMTLPPLPADGEPKIYFGYGFAYGYGDYSVDPESSSSKEVTEGNTSEKSTTASSSSSSEEKEENTLGTTTELSEESTSQETQES